MRRTYTNINIHIIFHVKYGNCKMKEEDLSRIFSYMGGIIRSLSCFAYTIGGRPDHVHMLISIPTTINLSDLIRTIKANSSKWIKGLGPAYQQFSWQGGYGAFSVSASKKDSVINYINNQKEHHRFCSAQEEFENFLKKHGINPNESSSETQFP